MKTAIFEEQTAKALKNWQKAAKIRKKGRKAGEVGAPSGMMSGETTPSHGSSSPLYLLHKYKSSSAPDPDSESVPNSPMANYHSDVDQLSDLEGSSHHHHHHHIEVKEESHGAGFTFGKP